MDKEPNGIYVVLNESGCVIHTTTSEKEVNALKKLGHSCTKVVTTDPAYAAIAAKVDFFNSMEEGTWYTLH